MSDYYIGLISGTSVDSIDAALVDFADNSPKLIASYSKHWPRHTRDAIFKTRQLTSNQLDSLQQLDDETGDTFAQAANELLQQAGISHNEVKAIGSHGQTIRHCPDIAKPFSLQIGNAQHISHKTGISVISDFRTADIKAGGQGAPMVPAFHHAMFNSNASNRVIVNIGGIANITTLPRNNKLNILGFDTGPGNNLMDAWIARHNQQQYDKDGALAASGKTNAKLLGTLLLDDYFQQPPPKSTGFEYFNMDWLNNFIDDTSNTADVQSTLCDLTATSIIRDINRYAKADEIFICGGGAHNTTLMQRLQNLTDKPVRSTEALGVHPDWVEAMTFAWLAKQFMENSPGNIPSATGAKHEVVLGTQTRA